MQSFALIPKTVDITISRAGITLEHVESSI